MRSSTLRKTTDTICDNSCVSLIPPIALSYRSRVKLTIFRPEIHLGVQEDGRERQDVGRKGLDHRQVTEEECQGGLDSWPVGKHVKLQDTCSPLGKRWEAPVNRCCSLGSCRTVFFNNVRSDLNLISLSCVCTCTGILDSLLGCESAWPVIFVSRNVCVFFMLVQWIEWQYGSIHTICCHELVLLKFENLDCSILQLLNHNSFPNAVGSTQSLGRHV